MKEFTISKNDANQRLDKFITKVCPTLPQGLMYKYIRTKHIKVNRKRAEISTRLNVGDVVEMYINDEFFAEVKPTYDFLSSPAKLDVVYAEDGLTIKSVKGEVEKTSSNNSFYIKKGLFIRTIL